MSNRNSTTALTRTSFDNVSAAASAALPIDDDGILGDDKTTSRVSMVTTTGGQQLDNSIQAAATTNMKFITSRVEFCRWNVLACINCVDIQDDDDDNMMPPSIQMPSTVQISSSSKRFDQQQSKSFGDEIIHESNMIDNNTVSSNRRKIPIGPLLLELKQIQFKQPTLSYNNKYNDMNHNNNNHTSNTTISLFETKTICQSRGNPALGTSVASTCLDVWKTKNDEENTILQLCATGLTTGALCIHSFSNNTENNNNNSMWIANNDYYHMPRTHRPATAVSWRPSSGHAGHYHVAIGLTGNVGHNISGTGGVLPSSLGNEHQHLASSMQRSSLASTSSGTIGSTLNPRNRTNPVSSLLSTTGNSSLPTTGTGGANVGGRPSSGDREYCCFLWDVEHQQQTQPSTTTTSSATMMRRNKTSTPLYKLSHQTGVASLAWILEGGQTLAVGGQQRNIQLYDLRQGSIGPSGGGGTPPIFTLYAHSHGVHGIEVDPNEPWRFVSWSRAPGEMVKIWDARRLESPIPLDIKVIGNYLPSNTTSPTKTIPRVASEPESRDATVPLSRVGSVGTVSNTDATQTMANIQQSNGMLGVTKVKWSKVDHGSLSILLGGTTIYDYEMSHNANSKPTLTNTIHVKQPILDLTHYPYRYEDLERVVENSKESIENTVQKTIMTELFPKRMVVVQSDRTVRDIAKHRIAPVSISRRDGRLVYALGRTLWIGSSSFGPCAIERQTIASPQGGNDTSVEDISCTMMRRARCSNKWKYGLDTKANIALLTEETNLNVSFIRDVNQASQSYGLLSVWTWIDRVEGLFAENVREDVWDESGGNNYWSSKSIHDSGVWKLLQLETGIESETQNISESLCYTTFDSEGRRAALQSCGWAGKQDLDRILGQCENLGEYERAAALAVWHGDVGSAVDALQRAAEQIRNHVDAAKTTRDSNRYISYEYAQILELVSLSIAGYRGTDKQSSATTIWQKASSHLLQRPELSDTASLWGGAVYLRHILKFLATIGIDDKHTEVLEDTTLSLSDRVAFACRFLSRSNLQMFLDKCIQECQNDGNVEGIVITGIETNGIKILESYVDRTADVQTAALLTSRVVFPSAEFAPERRIRAEWLQSYRSLLNTWQMWQSRAMFDVDRAQLLRRVKQRQTDLATTSTSGKIASNIAGRRMMPPSRRGVRTADQDIQASFPAQLDIRCNYCSAPLGLRKQDNQPNQWLSRMKDILSCCPNCRKPLPRCAICMLPLGALNPYTELTRQRNRSARPSSGHAGTGDESLLLSSLPFAEWFTWCVRCKHGGHAHHMVGWFAKHNVCPVSGCSCQCQFDAMPKLCRPTNSNSSNEAVIESS